MMTILTNGDTKLELVSPAGHRLAYTASDDRDVQAVESPVEYAGKRDVILNPDLMRVDEPVAYQLDGIDYVAIRRANGRLDFYELPSK